MNKKIFYISIYFLIISFIFIIFPQNLYADSPTCEMSLSADTVTAGYYIDIVMNFTNYSGETYYYHLDLGEGISSGSINSDSKTIHWHYNETGQKEINLKIYSDDINNPLDTDSATLDVTENNAFGFEEIDPGANTYIKLFNNINTVTNFSLYIFDYSAYSSAEEFIEALKGMFEVPDEIILFEDSGEYDPNNKEYNIDLDDGDYVAFFVESNNNATGAPDFKSSNKYKSFRIGSSGGNNNSGSNNKPKVYPKTTGGFIEYYYNKILLRNPDGNGYNAWLNAFNIGITDPKDMVFKLIFSKECQQKISDYNNEEYINFLYGHILGRQPDEKGFKNWLLNLNDGMSRKNILVRFLNSEEFENIFSQFNINNS